MKPWIIFVSTLLALPVQASEPWRDKSIALIKKEPKVRDAIWSAPGSLWVGVQDDGTSRDGFAEYICLLTGDAGKPENERFVVSIMDYRAMLQNRGCRKAGKRTLCGQHHGLQGNASEQDPEDWLRTLRLKRRVELLSAERDFEPELVFGA